MKRKRKNPSQPWTTSKFLVVEGTQFDSPQPPPDMTDCFVYLFGWEEIESGDTTRLVHDLTPNPNNRIFTAGPGKVEFAVHSYGDDLNEIVLENPYDLQLSPVFRAFVRKAEEAGACWLYFARPDSIWPRLMLSAGVMDFKTRNRDPLPMQIGVDTNDLQRFLSRQIRSFHSHCRAAGISRALADAYLDDALELWFPNLPPMAQAN